MNSCSTLFLIGPNIPGGSCSLSVQVRPPLNDRFMHPLHLKFNMPPVGMINTKAGQYFSNRFLLLQASSKSHHQSNKHLLGPLCQISSWMGDKNTSYFVSQTEWNAHLGFHKKIQCMLCLTGTSVEQNMWLSRSGWLDLTVNIAFLPYRFGQIKEAL